MKGMPVSSIGRVVALAAVVALALACGDDGDAATVNGAVDGKVLVTAPVTGAIVTAYAIDLETGELGKAIASSQPTDEDGAFHIDLGVHFGPLMLIARGVGATYIEPASGVTVAWDTTTELRALYVAWTPEQALTLDFKRGSKVTNVQLTPFSELAVAYGFARHTARKSPTLEEAFKHAHQRFRDFLKVDFWSVGPADLTRPTGAWNDSVQYGAELAGLSALVLKMAKDSQISEAGLSSLQLLGLLRRDIGDASAQFDGYENNSRLGLGDCDSICTFDACTISGRYAGAIASFLGSSANQSGIGVTDAQMLLEHLANPTLSPGAMELFPANIQCSLDSEKPSITVDGIDDADILSGQVTATVTFFDAVELGATSISFTRNDVPVTTMFYTASESSPNRQTKVVDLKLNTAQLNDGPVKMVLHADDAAGNGADLVYSLFFDNSPLGHISGTVVLGGRVQGARVSVYEYDGEVRGNKLGEAKTDDQGRYFVEVDETTQGVLLVEVDEAPGTSASYIEAVNGATVEFGPTDKMRTIITGWIDGQDRTDGMVTPWTEIAVQFAHGLYVTTYDKVPAQLPMAVSDAFAILEEHFNDGGPPINLRAVQPADLTSTAGTSTLNSQVRYGMVITALGKVAQEHAAQSGATSATMNTLTLTAKLAQDLGGTFTGSEAVPPLFDGRTGSGILSHGSVQLTSYVTRLDLAIGLVNFLASSRNATSFGQLDVALLLDKMSQDSRPVLYPADEPGGPFDVVPPQPVAFTAPTPTEGKVLRGTINLRVEASDNHSLSKVEWISPAGITGVTTDISAGVMGPWVLLGTLNTDGFAEGNLPIQARATDQAGLKTTVTRSVVIDRTNPVVVITSASTPGGPLAEGGVTGAAMITLQGTATDAHFQSANIAVNNGPAMPLTVGAGGNWSVNVPLVNGANTIKVTAVDQAGNVGADQATYNRDATPPTVVVVATSFRDDNLTGMTPTVATLTPATGEATGVIYANGNPRELVNGLVFTRFASDYGPTSASLPTWRFDVNDNHTAPSNVVLEVRLLRAGSLMVDWSAASAVVGAGFNRERVLHSGYHADLARISGTYTLEYRAKDEFGNTSSVGTLTWTQTLRPPPVRQRAGTTPCAASDPSCPSFYNLDNTLTNTSVAIKGGAGLPDGKLWVGQGFVDNPNDVPVRVKFNPSATAQWRRGSVYKHPQIADPSGIVTGCPLDGNPDTGIPDQLPNGMCFTPGSQTEVTTSLTSAGALTTDVLVVNDATNAVVPVCSGCAADEREIPAKTTVRVYVRANPFGFVWTPSLMDIMSLGMGSSVITNVTGLAGTEWLDCVQVNMMLDTCANQVRKKETQILTRIQVVPTARTTIDTKPASSSENFNTWTMAVPGEGTGANFGYFNFEWKTNETGFPPF